MVDFDEALNILENKARRAILKRLAKEPHYPLQLSELLEISEQAVVKLLRVLEEADSLNLKRCLPSKEVRLRRCTLSINHFR